MSKVCNFNPAFKKIIDCKILQERVLLKILRNNSIIVIFAESLAQYSLSFSVSISKGSNNVKSNKLFEKFSKSNHAIEKKMAKKTECELGNCDKARKKGTDKS